MKWPRAAPGAAASEVGFKIGVASLGLARMPIHSKWCLDLGTSFKGIKFGSQEPASSSAEPRTPFSPSLHESSACTKALLFGI
eukprot:1141684-Pelagomonas_calceolata.AAC.2